MSGKRQEIPYINASETRKIYWGKKLKIPHIGKKTLIPEKLQKENKLRKASEQHIGRVGRWDLDGHRILASSQLLNFLLG